MQFLTFEIYHFMWKVEIGNFKHLSKQQTLLSSHNFLDILEIKLKGNLAIEWFFVPFIEVF